MDLKPIKDYEGLYSLDLNTNQVYSYKYNKYLKPILNRGYYQIRLNKNYKQKLFHLHRLVYETYYGTIPQGLCIDHIDNDRINNNIDNLRLATYSENSCNKKTRKDNKSSGYKNIIKTKWNTFEVKIIKNNKKVYGKNFKSLEEAIKNRDIQLELHHKNFMNIG